MAFVHKGKNELANKYKLYLILSILFFLPTLIYFYAFMMYRFHFDGYLHLLGGVPALIGGYFYNISKSYRSGYNGEKSTLNILSKLPDDYHIFTSLPLNVDGKIGEIDSLVVGLNGIFVIEAKGMNGLIEGNEEDYKWMQHKVGRKGGRYSKKINNPIRQVKREVWMLSTLLKREGINNWIEGCVYFSNPDCDVEVFSPKVPVIQQSNDLYDFVLKYENKKQDVEVEKVVHVIDAWMRGDGARASFRGA